MFCTSPKGAEAAAIMYTIVETAKSNGADVYFYLKYLLEKAPSTPDLKVSRKYLSIKLKFSSFKRMILIIHLEDILLILIFCNIGFPWAGISLISNQIIDHLSDQICKLIRLFRPLSLIFPRITDTFII